MTSPRTRTRPSPRPRPRVARSDDAADAGPATLAHAGPEDVDPGAASGGDHFGPAAGAYVAAVSDVEPSVTFADGYDLGHDQHFAADLSAHFDDRERNIRERLGRGDGGPVSDPLNDPLPGDNDLIRTLADVRRKLREANRERGRTSLTVHMTRLERDKARADLRKANEQLTAQSESARIFYYRLRELFEAVKPGLARGVEFDDDYKAVLTEIRRLVTTQYDHELPQS